MKEMPYVFLFTSFFHCRSFSPGWSLTFLIFSPPLFMVLPIKKCLLCFFLISALALSLFFSLSFAGLSPTFYFSIFQICGHDNLFKLNIACVAGGIVAVLCGCEIKVLPSNLTRLYYNGSAAKSHSTTTQYRQLRRLSLIL